MLSREKIQKREGKGKKKKIKEKVEEIKGRGRRS